MKQLRMDWLLLLLILGLFSLGCVALYSAGGEARFWTQILRGSVGIAAMLMLAMISQRWFKHGAVVAFVIVLLMLVAVLFAGVKINNARRWLYLGFYIQPSELMKILLPLGLAYGYTLLPATRWWHHFAALAMVALPVLLVLKQPDFGTSALIIVAGVATVFFAGISWRWISGFAVGGVALLPVLWNFLKPYQQKRVLTMLDPYQDPLGAGYHTIQSQIAVGSGGIWGKGYLQGTQAQLGFLPERHTDFIFAVYAEEFGFVGSAVLLALVVLLVWRCLYIAAHARTRFAYLAVSGITSVFFFTFMVNVSMVSGLLPVVGMPLPLISYGGTALLATFAGFGFILSVARDNQPRRNNL
ncbi:MAG: rod shape-determining protein RodA [Proteobacteria bacterium]|nr:rod shape-determining protein RodA [Pseudomonadota bacterium]